jgi:hypothetical protein
MGTEEKVTMLERQLERYPASMDPSQVAESLGVSRKTVDKLLDEGRIECFILDPEADRKQKRVSKAVLIAFMLNNQLQ